MQGYYVQFDATFPVNYQVESVQLSLHTLVALLCHTNIKEQSLVTQTYAMLSMCQLIVFNSTGKQVKTIRHNKSREPPLSIVMDNLST